MVFEILPFEDVLEIVVVHNIRIILRRYLIVRVDIRRIKLTINVR